MNGVTNGRELSQMDAPARSSHLAKAAFANGLRRDGRERRSPRPAATALGRGESPSNRDDASFAGASWIPDTSMDWLERADDLEYETRDRMVLMVDDDRAIREALEDILGQLGYTVIGVCDGAEALDYLRRSTLPDVVLLDLAMPVMDGWKLRTELLNDRKLAQLPVVVMTAARNQSAEELQVSEILGKPIELHLLISALERHTASKTHG